MANRTDPDAKSVHGTNPQVRERSGSKARPMIWDYNIMMHNWFFLLGNSLCAREVSHTRMCGLMFAFQPIVLCLAEPDREDPSDEDLQFYVLEGALLCPDS